MNTYENIAHPLKWIMAILLVFFAVGCHNNSGGSAATDTIPPTVISVNPATASTAIALNSSVNATFSKALNPLTITSATFTLSQGVTPIPGTVAYAGTTAAFYPTSNLTASTVYTATLSTGIKDVAGNALASNYTWTFTTGTTLDTTAPTVNSVIPISAATGTSLNTTVNATFSELMDPLTISATTFTLKQGTTTVAGTVSYKGTTATFTPTQNLAASLAYTATITTGAKDMSSNALATNYSWSFTTGTSVAAGPAPVNLGTAGSFVILTKTGITNVHTSAITGNIGSSPITAAAMDNVFCSEITGSIYGADAAYTGSGTVTCFKGLAADITLVGNAILDMMTAYTDAAGRSIPDYTELGAGNISGMTLVPGLYKWSTGVLITNAGVTLSGGPNDVWIFQIAQDLTLNNSAIVHLTGGAVAKNIFWQVGGGVGVAIGTTAQMEGVILAAKGITLNTNASGNVRLLAQTAVTLQQNTVTQPAP